MLKHLPNALTLMRLFLAVPLGITIVQQQYDLALLIGLVAGASDALDGLLARKFNAFSRLGAILDPIADKTIITACFLCFGLTDLVPWYLAVIVIARDIVIVSGASVYTLFYGQVEFAATTLSKSNMCFQIGFCLLLLLSLVVTGIPTVLIDVARWLVIFFALASGLDYVVSWSGKARDAARLRASQAFVNDGNDNSYDNSDNNSD